MFSIRWYKDDVLIAENDTSGIYTAPDTDIVEGVYRCEAFNTYGMARSGELKILRACECITVTIA